MTNQQIADAFAGRTLAKARNASLSFQGTRLYTYGELLAELHGAHNDAYVNSTQYSSTSSGHRSLVIRALEARGFTVHRVEANDMPSNRKAEG